MHLADGLAALPLQPRWACLVRQAIWGWRQDSPGLQPHTALRTPAGVTVGQQHWLLCRWGNKLSNKLFMGKEFVLKHIRLKHAARVETELARVGRTSGCAVLHAPL